MSKRARVNSCFAPNVKVRVIAATNVPLPLEEKVADGSFREDLYYCLNVIRLRVPPLGERHSEIPPTISRSIIIRYGSKNAI